MSRETTAKEDPEDLSLGLGLVAVAPVFAAVDIILVGRNKITLGSKRSLALWTAAFTCGLTGSLVVVDVLHGLVNKIEKVVGPDS